MNRRTPRRIGSVWVSGAVLAATLAVAQTGAPHSRVARVCVPAAPWASARGRVVQPAHGPAKTSPPATDGKPTEIVEHAEPRHPDADAPSASSKIAEATRGVIGSKHDFSAPSGREGDACRACHVPHVLAVKPGADRLGENLLAFYRMGGQREVLVTDRYTPGPSSLMCLSCHNGAVASSVLGSAHAILAGKREGFAAPQGWDVRDHPIGVAYPEHRDGYRPRAVVEADGRLPLPDGRVECTSCHDPHNRAGIEAMLVMSNRRSALCLACHEK